jgi:hypothetical protein
LTPRRRRNAPAPDEPEPLRQLREIAARGGTPLLAAARVAVPARPGLVVAVRLDTSAVAFVPDGLPVNADHEDVLLWFTSGYPQTPPLPFVAHDRFVGYPHVLQGDRLCVHLDPEQEWHPRRGVAGFLDDLYTWFEDAAAGRFDARTALYHPVGGVQHARPGFPTVVVRAEPTTPFGPFVRRRLHARTHLRLDVVPEPRDPADPHIAVITVDAPLRYGAGTTLNGLAGALIGADRNRVRGALSFLAETAALNPPDQPLYFLLAVRSPAGGSAHLICGRVAPTDAQAVAATANRPGARPGEVALTDIPFDAEIEWCTVSEERPSAAIRRDRDRPVAAYSGKHVVIWGCGGLGSWIAELVVRAGAASLTLCDPGNVTGGLLVRQNYTEDDLGETKAEALAHRLRAVSDTTAIDVAPGPAALDAKGNLPACDVLIDATVSNGPDSLLSDAWQRTAHRPVVAKVSTDRRTCTLGLLTVTTPGYGPAPEHVDRSTGDSVGESGGLEAHHVFWREPDRDDELTPEPGCSTPTFHGSAADLAAVAGTLTSLLAPHLKSPEVHGSHLVGLPHGPAPGHHWIPGRG